ncbi:hypothetical protein JOE50_008001 [Bradyrhizobium japonicum]|nr:hypothetical protein [Bradyrhizobium japonicum]
MLIVLNVNFAAPVFAICAYLHSRNCEPQRARNDGVARLVISGAASVSVSFRLLRLHVIP